MRVDSTLESCSSLPSKRVSGLTFETYSDFHTYYTARGVRALKEAMATSSYLQGFRASFVVYRSVPTPFLLAAYYIAYVCMRFVLRVALPVFKSFSAWDGCRASQHYMVEVSGRSSDSEMFQKLRICANAFLSYRNWCTDYVCPQATEFESVHSVSPVTGF